MDSASSYANLIIYCLIGGFVIFILLCQYIKKEDSSLPSFKNKVVTLLDTPQNTAALQAQYVTLTSIYELAFQNLTNMNTQIVSLQNTINALEAELVRKREIYLAEENNILQQIQFNIQNIRLIPYNNNSAKNIVDNYIALNSYVDSNITKLDDYYSVIHNSLSMAIAHGSVVKDKYSLADALNLFLFDVNFGVYCQQEIDGLLNSVDCRDLPQYLLDLCQSNNIIALNAIYIPSPIQTNIVGINQLKILLDNQTQIILDIVPLTS